MEEYTIEYTRQGFAYLLLLSSLGILALEMIIGRLYLKNIASPAVAVLTMIASVIAFFLLNKHRIKRTATAKLSKNNLILDLDRIVQIDFKDLKYYYIYDGKNGIVFTLGFLNGTKFKLGANNSFCDITLLRNFLSDFQSAIEKFKTQQNQNIIHLETIMARKNTPYVLGALTLFIILGFCFMSMPLMILPIGMSLPIIINWIIYFQQRRKGTLVDF